jgi:hypothetical protein
MKVLSLFESIKSQNPKVIDEVMELFKDLVIENEASKSKISSAGSGT